MKYDFPGNIRELKNIIEHALIRSGGAVIQPEHLHFVDAGNGRGDHPTDIETERPASASAEFRVAESKVILRAQKRSSVNEGADQDRESVTDEERILAYLKEHSSISNTECRELLDVDRYRANYLLDKLYRYKLVVREGEFRWLRYMLADDDQRG
jgi:DNA-binding NtrC family response regulator